MPTKKTTGNKLADMMYGSGEIRPTPQSRITGPIANAVRKAQEFASQYEVSPSVPLLGGTSVDELLSLPGAASLLEDVSYNGMGALIRGGNAATGGIGTFRLDPRIIDTADLVGTATGVGALGKGAVKTGVKGAMAAGRAGERMAEKYVPKIMERGGAGADIMRDMAQGSRSYAYLPHTPQKPDPTVGSRFKTQSVGNLAPKTDFNIETEQGSSVMSNPWDSTSRGEKVLEVSDIPLSNQITTEGGQDFARDIANIQANVGGASGRQIAERMQDRVNDAYFANMFDQGTGRVFTMPSTMDVTGSNYSTMPTDIVMDIFQQASPNKKEVNRITDDLRSFVFEEERGKFKNAAQVGSPEFLKQLREGGDGFSAGDLRKGLMNRMSKSEYQKMLGFNIEDVYGAIHDPTLEGLPKGFVGNTMIETSPYADIRPSTHQSYDSANAGKYAGSMPSMPLELMMPDLYQYMETTFLSQPKYQNLTPNQLRTMIVNTIEKRGSGISQPINQRVVDNVMRYKEGLKQGHFNPKDHKSIMEYMSRSGGYKEGGSVQFSDNPDVMQLELAGGGLVKGLAKGFFSAVDKTAQNLKRPAGTGKEFMAEVKAAPGIKATELKGRKLAEIEAMPKMTKEQFIKELEARPPVKIEEKVFGNPSQKEIDALADKLAYDKAVENARYYGERGDDIDALAEENYLSNIRNNLEELREEARRSLIDDGSINHGIGRPSPYHEKYTIPGGENYREILLKAPAAKGEGFLGTPAHFGGEPNILASIRVSDRTGPNGEKILHVEEIQSDWHQAGRDKGYKEEYKSRFGDINGQQMKVSDLIAQQGDAGIKWIEGKNSVNRDLDLPELAGDDLINVVTENGAPVYIKEARVSDLDAQERQLFNRSQQEKLPDAPFKKDWQELALRRVMQEAAEGGYDTVALTKGAEQADRYDLSKYVDTVIWEKNPQGKITFTPEKDGMTLTAPKTVSQGELENQLGKEVAEKILRDQETSGALSGLDLKIGDKGMKGFYDKMLPDYLNKLGKQYGVKVDEIGIQLNPETKQTTYNFNGRPSGEIVYPSEAKQVHSFEVTPQMREDINTKGQPLYQQIGIPVGAGTAGTGTATIAPEGLRTNDEQQVQNPVNFTENPDAMLLELMQRN
jgi:hypothetical protein